MKKTLSIIVLLIFTLTSFGQKKIRTDGFETIKQCIETMPRNATPKQIHQRLVRCLGNKNLTIKIQIFQQKQKLKFICTAIEIVW